MGVAIGSNLMGGSGRKTRNNWPSSSRRGVKLVSRGLKEPKHPGWREEPKARLDTSE